MSQLKALIIDTPYIDNILSGKKMWEMRSMATKTRGTIALVRKGSGTVIGVADVIGSEGPLCSDEMWKNQHRHMIPSERLADPKIGKWKHAWLLQNARRLPKPIVYHHPSGAVIWVNLDVATSDAVLKSAGPR